MTADVMFVFIHLQTLLSLHVGSTCANVRSRLDATVGGVVPIPAPNESADLRHTKLPAPPFPLPLPVMFGASPQCSPLELLMDQPCAAMDGFLRKQCFFKALQRGIPNQCSSYSFNCTASQRYIAIHGDYLCAPLARLHSVSVVHRAAAAPPGAPVSPTTLSTTQGGDVLALHGTALSPLAGSVPAIRLHRPDQDWTSGYRCISIASTVNASYVECTTTPGVGAVLLVHLEVGGVTGGTAPITSTNISQALNYPPPFFIQGTLRRYGLGTEGANASWLPGTLSAPPSNFVSELVALQGLNFMGRASTDAQLVSAFYGNATDPFKYPCDLAEDALNATSFVCRTHVPGYGQGLHFSISVANQTAISADTYNYPQEPVVTAVDGCVQDGALPQATVQCPTQGGSILTITGRQLVQPINILVGGQQCSINTTSVVPNGTQVECVLGTGVGSRLSVQVSQWDLRSAAPPRLVSYAPPELHSLQGCSGAARGWTNATTDCARNGTSLLRVRGQYFGASGASVLVGGQACLHVTTNQSDAQEELECVLPSGYGKRLDVLLVQNGGLLSYSSTHSVPLLVSYEQCGMGEYDPSISASRLLPCAPCRSGHVSRETGASKCDECPAGSVPASNHSVCMLCPVGKYDPSTSTVPATACSDCAPGLFSAQSGAVACSSCSPGSVAVNTSACVRCAAGRYDNSSASAPAIACSACPPGLLSVSGAVVCTRCVPGSVVANSSSCVRCPAGKHDPSTSVVPATACSDCAPGLFSAQSGAVACTRCIPGSVATNTSSCVRCAPGKYDPSTSAVPATACSDCAPGLFSAQSGAVACTRCIPGSVATNTSSCVRCAPGKHDPSTSAVPATACSDCAPGFFSTDAGAVQCGRCDPGTVATSSIACQRCSAGKYDPSNASTPATACYDCAPGLISAQSGAVACTRCIPGSVATNTSSCVRCAPGKHDPSTSAVPATACSDCAPGLFSAQSGAVACSSCSPGSVAVNTSACVRCAAGRYDPSNASVPATSCLPCLEHMVAEQAGSIHCTTCPQGFVPHTTSSCRQCAAGTFANASRHCASCPDQMTATSPGLVTCSSCPRSTIWVNASVPCVPCPAEQVYDHGTCSCRAGHVPIPGGVCGSSAGCCQKCAAGRFAAVSGATSCEKCPAPLVALLAGSTECVQCPPSQFRQTSSTCGACGANEIPLASGQCVCQSGFFKLATCTNAVCCQSCDSIAGAFCPHLGGNHSETEFTQLEARDGYWRDPQHPSSFLTCPYGPTCAAHGCTEHSHGECCTRCDEGFYLDSFDTCSSCRRGAAAFTTTLLCVAVVLLIALLSWYMSRRSIQWASIEEDLDGADAELSISVRSESAYSTSGRSRRAVIQRSGFSLVLAVFKLIVGHVQILSLIVTSRRGGRGNSVYPSNFHSMVAWLGVLLIRWINLVPLGCLTPSPYTMDLVIALLTPVVLVLVVLLASVPLRRRFDALDLKHRRINAYCLLLFLVYPFITSEMLEVFNCVSCGDRPSFVAAQATLPCRGGHYTVLVAAAALGLLVITLGIPVLFLRILHLNKEDLFNPASDVALKYSFLYLDFHPSRWWYEVLEMTERVMYAAVAVFMSNGSSSQVSAELLITMASLLLMSVLRPYESTVFQVFGIFSRVVVCLTLYGALLTQVEVDDAESGAQLGVLLILVNSLALAVPFGYMCFMVWHVRQNKEQGLANAFVGQRSSMSTMDIPLLKSVGRSEKEQRIYSPHNSDDDEAHS